MEYYEKHIQQTHEEKVGVSWCDVPITRWDFAFVSVEHAAYNNLQGGRLLPCQKCVDAIVKALRENLA